MNDPAVKAALAISILVVGVFLASLFRSDPAATLSPASVVKAKSPMSLRSRRQPAPPCSASSPESRLSDAKKATEQKKEIPAALGDKATASAAGPTILVPLGPPPPVPNLPEHYSNDVVGNSARWGITTGMMPDGLRPAESRQVHKIVDGDTLRDIAERYLGSPDRAQDIFDANRDVLSSSQLLPIGVELKIPPRASR